LNGAQSGAGIEREEEKMMRTTIEDPLVKETEKEQLTMAGTKLPRLPFPTGSQVSSNQMNDAWVKYMVKGFENNEEMFRTPSTRS
jgi:hypothetical protein